MIEWEKNIGGATQNGGLIFTTNCFRFHKNSKVSLNMQLGLGLHCFPVRYNSVWSEPILL